MNIAQALKEKNKKLAEISKFQLRISENNSVEEGNTRDYDPRETLTSLDNERKSLVILKEKIHMASMPVRGKIFEMSELKSHVKFLRGVSTKTGTIRSPYSREDGYKVESKISTVEMDQLIKDYENQIEQTQAELDTFNHSTSI